MNFKTSILKLVITTSILICFAGCKKATDIQAISSVTSANNSINPGSNLPVILTASTKSTNIINGVTGEVKYHLYTSGTWDEKIFTQSPVIVQNLVVNFFGKHVRAYALKDSSLKWDCNITPVGVERSYCYTSYPVIAGNVLMFCFYAPNQMQATGTYAINIPDGRLLWFNNEVYLTKDACPTYAKKLLLVNGGGQFFAIDVATGKTKWIVFHGYNIYPACTDSNYVYYAKSSGDIMFPNDTLFARSISDGTLLWQKQLSKISYSCYPLISGNHLYVTNTDTLLNINKTNGALIWKFTTSKKISGFTACFANDGLLYISSQSYSSPSAHLYALSEQNGSVVWSQPISLWFGSMYDGPVVIENKVYQRYETSYYSAYNKKTGKPIFKTRINEGYVVDPDWAPTYIDANGEMVYSSASGMH